MFSHGPSCLTGPVTRERAWWLDDDEAPLRGRETIEMDNPENEQSREDRPFRAELVERVRREIAEGTYETPEKWEAALDRLLERLQEE